MHQLILRSWFFFSIFILIAQVSWSQTHNRNESRSEEPLKLNLPVIKYQLKNGLTVLLYSDSSVPMISFHTWYKVGSRDEAEGVTGAAHMLEHMMFKGSKKYSNKDFDRILHENGITNNAFTTYDYTGFYQNLPSSKLELMMQLEVDRMANLLLRPEDLLSEREVVKEERRWRVDNNPMGLLRELAMSTVFREHPYRWPVIGTMKDISQYEVSTLRKFHETYYVPNNAILVLAGDFKVVEARKLIDRYYGPLLARPVPVRNYKKEPLQTVQYNANLKQDVQGYSFMLAYQAVPHGHSDMYALDLASQILGSGTSSRLYRRLVYNKQLATSAYSWHSNMADQGLFSIGVNLKPGLDMQEALDIVYNEMYKLRVSPVTAKELQKAKTLSIKSLVDSLTTIDGKARLLAASEILTGSYETLFSDLEKYNKVSAEDILKVSQKYFNQTQRSVIVLEPKKKGAL
ncbi:MAG: pitrilysin family protein [Bdellovibrionota bacterium]